MAVGEIIVSALLTVLLEKLASADLWKLARGEGIASQLKKSRKLLSLLQAVLVDAGHKQITEAAVRDWLTDLQVLTYDLDDIVDDMVFEATRRQLTADSRASSSSSMVSCLIPTCLFASRSHVFGYGIKSKLDDITQRLEDLIAQKDFLDLRENISSSSSTTVERLPTTSLVDESSVEGRENDKEAILHLVLNDKICSGREGIIPIVGMGGVGKTTLAQLVYNEEKVKSGFDVRVWVCVSEDFDVFMITKSIYHSVTKESENFDQLNQLQEALKERISNKKFLIVMDDVWNENYDKWELFQRPFLAGKLGSKILVTTRSNEVVSTMRCVSSYQLKELKPDESVTLFAQNSLGSRDFSAHPHFKSTGERIVRRCGGLPLALKTLGRLLHTKERVEDWEELLESNIWDLPKDKSSIHPALRLSYHYLPPNLKQLFAFCSLFPNDYSFDKDELVFLWMAQGYLQNSASHLRMEDLGQKNFEELLSRSFFQHSSDRDTRYVMHDLMNELAQVIAGDFIFRSDDEKKNVKEHRVLERFRHASFIRHQYDVFSNFKEFHKAKVLRTFLPLPVQKLKGYPDNFYISGRVLVDLIPEFRCLRVLSLSGYSIRELPGSIGGMKHLRYLNLSQTRIECLPQWVSDLYNLQTLLLFECRHLTRLPTTFVHLINMRHFNIAGTLELKEMPLGIGTLTTLQTLSRMILNEGKGSRLRELKELSDLRGTLSITGLHNVMYEHDAGAANLISKKGLDDLGMKWSDDFYGSRNEALEMKILDALKPHTNLRRLNIEFYGGVEFPSWVGNPSFCHIREVILSGCRKCTSLPSLGQLPLLKKLFIWSAVGVKVVGSEFYNAGKGRVPVVFPSLEILQFEDMGNWEEWTSTENVDDDVSVFPCLRELHMLDCPKLVKASPGKLPSVQHLSMRGCGEVALRSMLQLASEITTLELQNIAGLTELHEKEVDQFVGVKIVDLKIKDCKELKYLWRRGAEAYANLKRLNVIMCHQLVSLVEGEEVLPRNLEELDIGSCENLEKLPHNWGSNLKRLEISYCPKLQNSSGTTTMTQQGLDEGRNGGGGGGGGIVIKKSGSNSLLNSKSEMEEEEEGFCQLERMHISGCSSMRWLPTGGQKKKKLPASLKDLTISGWEELEEPEDKNWLLNTKSSLESIQITAWGNLKSFFTSSSSSSTPEGRLTGGGIIGFQNFIHLTKLAIWNCPGLESFTERGGGGLPPCLKELVIFGCENLKWLLPDSDSNCGGWDQCHSLTTIWVFNCPRLEGFPCGVWPPNLQELELGGGGEGKPNDDITEWGLHNAPSSLKRLTLYDKFPELVSFSSTNQSSPFLLPPSLTHLFLDKMEKLETLSNGLQNLTSLQYLNIRDCPKLSSLPETLFPTLHSLIIWNCPILKERCNSSSKKQKGSYWSLLSSLIPYVMIAD